ncbi:hypothetical protein H6F87_26220 [Cyanobacteria bacterium FACHB-502]|nr:hypothetical protein [Cyanobacteria bacterium FACHB-502]
MPLLTVLEQSFEQQTRQRQKRQSKTQKLPQVGSKRHSISLSAAGWEGLATLALGVHRSDAETIELLGNHAAQLQQPLADWLKKPEESIVRQILASPP